MAISFEILDKTEQSLDGLKGWLDNTFASIGVYGQEGADAIMHWTGDWVTYKIERLELRVVRYLHGIYEKSLSTLTVAGPIYKLVTGGVSADLGALVTGILKVAAPWVPPTLAAIQAIAEVPLKVVSVASKVSSLAAYQPPLPSDTIIDTSAFNIHPRMISMGDIISGSFTEPEAPGPFTEYMKDVIDGTKQKIREERAAQGQTTSIKSALGIKSKSDNVVSGGTGEDDDTTLA